MTVVLWNVRRHLAQCVPRFAFLYSNRHSPDLTQRNPLQEWIDPLRDCPCWGIQAGRAMNLSMNFGEPSLFVRAPLATTSVSPTIQAIASRRLVTIRGEWLLWLWACHWSLSRSGETLATGASSQRRIDRATLQLSGQKLVSATVDEKTGATRFQFDLGAELHCRRYDANSREELWLLYRPNGEVLSVSGDGSLLNQRSEVRAGNGASTHEV